MYRKGNDELVTVAYPGSYLDEPVRPGDRLVRWSPAEGIDYTAVVVSDRPESAADLAARGVPVEYGRGGSIWRSSRFPPMAGPGRRRDGC